MTIQERREYPAALAMAEQAWIDTRRAAINADAGDDPAKAVPPGAPQVGLALSGGGIRSATFSLGVIQAFVKLGLLRRVDLLSTVSGGGYIGGFLGRLYSRHYATPSIVEYLMHPQRAGQPHPPWSAAAATDDETRANLKRMSPFDWLRDNGRYLAPNGSGDIMLAFAVAIRNWVALQTVFASFLLVPLLFAQILRRLFDKSGIGAALGSLPASLSDRLNAAGSDLVDWSPFIDLVPVLLMLLVFPLGWAFWLIEKRRRMEVHPDLGVGLLILISVGALQLSRPPMHFNWWQPLFYVLIGSSLLALAFAQGLRALAESTVLTSEDLDGDRITHARNLATRWLSMAVAATLGLFAFSIIDTFGQTFYEHFGDSRGGVAGWTAALIAAATPFVVRLTRLPALLTAIGGGKNKPGIKLPVEWLAALAAAVLALIVLIGLDAFAHAIADGFVRIDEMPRHFWLPLTAFALLLVFAALFGWTWPFLNLSSQSSLYRSRLARAYLGASNWRRFQKSRDASVTDTIAGDDIRAEDYWRKVVGHGGPLHLINVTINETAGDDAKTVLRDRKGISLAVGPCGYSAGARHHALRTDETEAMARAAGGVLDGPRRKPTSERREPVLALRGKTGYSMFYRRETIADDDAMTMPPPDGSPGERPCVAGLEQVEKLSLGQWIAISGAAFTTGLGSRTTIGLSFLLGFANVRLGYWWDAGDRMDPPAGVRATLNRLLRTVFPIQCYLLDEFTATFRGPGTRRWYLSDGGHFENMGAYELIRRRVPMIVIVDGEEDTRYSYEGLGNLVRKARLDFGAEIEFLDDAGLKAVLHPELLPLFGDLDALRPHGDAGFSPKHAALARVRYTGSDARSLIVYLKPTLTIDDPVDVREYRSKNPDFPQQSTLNQFFDESQWESYRKLGEVIASRVFAKPTSSSPWFSPNCLWPEFKPGSDDVSAGSAGTSSSRGSRGGSP